MSNSLILLHVLEMVLFVILFPVVIVKSDYQLVYGIERGGFALFLVCYQILDVRGHLGQCLVTTEGLFY